MGLFSKKNAKLPVLRFENGEQFVDYHCSYMTTRLERGLPLAALVLDAREEFGTQAAVKLEENGVQTAVLRVASDDGGFTVIAQTASEKGDALKPGDAVAWIPETHMPRMADAAGDERSCWIGFIIAKIAPEIDENTKQMTVISAY